MLMVPVPAMAQVIRGTITDAGSSARIPIANITLLNRANGVITRTVADTTGEFHLPVPALDSVRVQVDRIGYGTVTSPAYWLARGELLEINVRLSSHAVTLAPVTVVARNPVSARLRRFYERADQNRRVGRGRIWMREDLERSSPGMLSNLYDAVPRGGMVGCRGTTIYLDDLPVSRDDLNMMVQLDDVEGIEIYRDMDIPYEYGMGQCMVMLIWRKPYGEGGKPLTWHRVFMAAGIIGFIGLLEVLF